jgi:hypothetical protein
MSDNRKSFKDDILAEAVGPIIGIKIPLMGSSYTYSKDTRDDPIEPYADQVISWEIAAPLLDYPYYAGFGSMDCHGIIAWTETQVIYIHEYDGSTSVCSLPRNP